MQTAIAESDREEEGTKGPVRDDTVCQDVVVREFVKHVVKFSKMDERFSAQTKTSGGEKCYEQ